MKKSQIVVLLIFIALSFLALSLSPIPPFSFLRRVSQEFFSTPKNILYQIRTSFTADSSEIEKLKKENKKLAEKVVDFEKLKADNQAFRSQFEISEIRSDSLFPARVVGFLGEAHFPKSIILDKGKLDGVQEGMSVVSGKNFVGKIKKAAEKYSQVMLVTNKDFVTLGKTSRESVQGVIRGEEDFVLFDKVSITQNLEVGDIVITKGELKTDGIGVQNDLIVGKITSINKKNSQPFQTAKVETFLNFNSLDMVFILKEQ